METKLIRVTKPDYDRITFMKGYLSITKFITSLLDEAEQPKVIEEVKPKRPNPTLKKEKKVHAQFAALREIYTTYWYKYNNFDYQWNGVIDSTALNRLIKSLENIKESDKSITDLFAVLMDKLPEFYKNKSINAINKNLNSIIADIKNGGNKTNLKQDGGIYDFRN